MGKVVALIMAGGSGRRISMNYDAPKQYMNLGDKLMIRHAVEAFLSHPMVDEVAVVVRPEDVDICTNALADLKILPLIFGGDRRQDSVYNGLKSIMSIDPDKVLVHDAARPFVTKRVITSVINQLDFHDAVITAIPVADTIKKCSDDKVIWTVDRTDLWKSQTPQGFSFDKLLKVHEEFGDKSFTDDASICEYAGIPVCIVPGSVSNFKISKEEDYQFAENVIKTMKKSDIVVEDYISGFGYDMHRIVKCRTTKGTIMLGGVHVESGFDVVAHSDGDVVLHAICDAIFGTIGENDIGYHFPDSDARWKDVDSKGFVKFALERLSESGGRLLNLDVTIVAEEPKINPVRTKIRGSLAKILSIPVTRIAIKACTAEELDAVGRKEAIAAKVLVTVALERF